MTKVLELALLGELRITLDGEPLAELKSSKAQALLCYLAATGRPHSRQALAELLWGHLPAADGRRNLRGALLKLRRFVAPYLIVTHRTLAFDRERRHWLDVEAFRARLQSRPGDAPDPAQLLEAVALYRGEFLEDLHVRDAPSFDEWVDGQRTQVREMALTALNALAAHFTAKANYGAGIEQARRMLSLDPIREEGWQHLIRLLALNGQRNAALSEYENCASVLTAELGVPPSPETTTLYERIRSGNLRPIPGNGPGARLTIESRAVTKTTYPETVIEELPPFVAGPPLTHPGHFFGRERELRRLFNMLKRPPLQNAAVIGPRRSGKTSLLHYLKNIGTAAPEQVRPGQRTDWLPSPHRYRWIFVDFQDPRLGSMETLLRHLLVHMDLRVPEPCGLEAFLNIVTDGLNTPTVILLDEIGVALQRYPELDDAFWESLRALATNLLGGNLGFVLAGAEPPDQMARHTGFGSPFFNIFGYTAVLGPLSESEARLLIDSSPIPFAPRDVDWILTQSGRWPILLQILCRERLLALEEHDTGDGWRDEALRQTLPFMRSLTGENPYA